MGNPEEIAARAKMLITEAQKRGKTLSLQEAQQLAEQGVKPYHIFGDVVDGQPYHEDADDLQAAIQRANTLIQQGHSFATVQWRKTFSSFGVILHFAGTYRGIIRFPPPSQ